MSTITKVKVLEFCNQLVSERIKTLKLGLEKLAIAKASEGKSSMGDKYETSREMLRQEESKIEGQLAIYQDHLRTLNVISNQGDSESTSLGSLVQTNTGWFFIGPALGQLDLSPKVFCLSQESPMGRQLEGRQTGDSFELNGRKIEILKN